MTIQEKYDNHCKETEELEALAENIYQVNFGSYLMCAAELKSKFSSEVPISDSDLEMILTSLPLQLIDVSENISKLKLKREAWKLQTKQREHTAYLTSSESTDTKRREAAALSVLDDKLMVDLFTVVISRAESDVSMYRELIMGAKKVWDSRRKSDGGMPVQPVSQPDLPEYDKYSTGSKVYIK